MLKNRIFVAGPVFVMGLVLGGSLTAADVAVTGEMNNTINRFDVGQQDVEAKADVLVRSANKDFAEGKYPKAIDQYIAAIEVMKVFTTDTFKSKIEQCRRQIGRCYYYMAEEAMQNAEERAEAKDFEEAIKVCREAIKYYPEGSDLLNSKIALYEKRQQAAIERTDASEDKLLPDKRSQDYQIHVLIQQGRELMAAKEYGKALRKFQDVLLINPYNSDALQNVKACYIQIQDTGLERYKTTHRKMIAEVEWKGAIAITPSEGINGNNLIEAPNVSKVEAEESMLQNKLNNIRIPRVDFENVTISSAIDNLRNLSKNEDKDKIGVNIFLRRVDRSAAFNATGDAAAAPAAGAAVDPATGEDTGVAERSVSLIISNVTLMQAIEQLCQIANLNYRIDKYAVVLAPVDIALEKMETRIYPLDQSALSAISGGGEDKSGLQKFFEDYGIRFPQNAKIVYDTRISRLIVTNTVDNLRRVEQIINEVLDQQEPMVQVMAKYIEISQEDLDELAFNYQIAYNSDLAAFNNNSGGRSQARFDASSNELTRYYREENSVNTRHPFNEGTFSYLWQNDKGTGLAASMYALDWADSVDILGSPRVTTLPGHTAHVEMVIERYFPEDWEVVDPPENNGGNNSGNSSSAWWECTRNDPFPNFESEPTKLGITFDITPDVDKERRTITANVILPVVAFAGWMVYDNTGPTTGTGSESEYIKMPIFDKREINTTITVYDGETIVLGGVAADTVEVLNDQIPVLGDLPLVGRLFQSKYTKSTKRNLLVFITCRLVKPDGTPFFPAEVRAKGLADLGRLY